MANDDDDSDDDVDVRQCRPRLCYCICINATIFRIVPIWMGYRRALFTINNINQRTKCVYSFPSIESIYLWSAHKRATIFSHTHDNWVDNEDDDDVQLGAVCLLFGFWSRNVERHKNELVVSCQKSQKLCLFWHILHQTILLWSSWREFSLYIKSTYPIWMAMKSSTLFHHFNWHNSHLSCAIEIYVRFSQVSSGSGSCSCSSWCCYIGRNWAAYKQLTSHNYIEYAMDVGELIAKWFSIWMYRANIELSAYNHAPHRHTYIQYACISLGLCYLLIYGNWPAK